MMKSIANNKYYVLEKNRALHDQNIMRTWGLKKPWLPLTPITR
jgi:hypothetical protein